MELLTEGLDSIRNVCVLCRALPYGWRQCERSVGPRCAVNNSSTTHTHIVPPRRSRPETRGKRRAILFDRGSDADAGDETRFSFRRSSVGRWASACPTVPGFALFCGRIRGRPGGKSGLEGGRGRAVGRGDGVHSLDHHLHVLPHGAGPAETLDGFQEREATSRRRRRTSETARSAGGGGLRRRRGGRRDLHLGAAMVQTIKWKTVFEFTDC